MSVDFSMGIYTTQEPGPLKSEVLLVDTLNGVSERMRADKMLPGDDLLAAKPEAVGLAMAEDEKYRINPQFAGGGQRMMRINPKLPMEEQVKFMDRSIAAVTGVEKAMLEMDETLLERFEGSKEVKEEIREDLALRRETHEENLRWDRERMELEKSERRKLEVRSGGSWV